MLVAQNVSHLFSLPDAFLSTKVFVILCQAGGSAEKLKRRGGDDDECQRQFSRSVHPETSA
jgi:hypothetical protein